MNLIACLAAIILLVHSSSFAQKQNKIFDVHLHGDPKQQVQLEALKSNGVRVIAVSTSWSAQQTYKSDGVLSVLQGLMLPCPNGKVPYSLQPCFDDGKEWPDPKWVEEQIKNKRIQFLGEVLSQYYGISSSDSAMYPYYAIAEKYNLPVGIHTGSAGPDHGCPNFKEELGNPLLLKKTLASFPKLRVWLMHGGGPYIGECIEIMKVHPNVYADISVLNNPRIIPADEFSSVMKKFIDAGLEDRIMFGSDNGQIDVLINSVDQLPFLTAAQKEKIFHLNAEKFFKEQRD